MSDLREALLVETVTGLLTDSSPTALLSSGWYHSRIAGLIDGNSLDRLVQVERKECPDYLTDDNFEVIKLRSLGKNECAVLQKWAYDAEIDSEKDSVYEMGRLTSSRGRRIIQDDALFGYPLDQCCGGFVYLKNAILPPRCDCYFEGNAPCEECMSDSTSSLNDVRFTFAVFRFPMWPLSASGFIQEFGGDDMDVMVSTRIVSERTRRVLVQDLGRLDRERRDSPVPMYHNIIDPNIGSANSMWVPTDFEASDIPEIEVVATLNEACRRATGGKSLPSEISEKIWSYFSDGDSPVLARCRMKSGVPDIDARDNAALCVALEDVLEAALPLLARLRRPALLLPGPLQAVVKAQRIVLREDEVYEGAWHEDGLRESVVAVVLYYYGVSANLAGGMMEFASKDRMVMWIGDNCGNFPLDEQGARHLVAEMPRCKVPISEGTMLVFSNYAAIHRVLRMVNGGGSGRASRDFVAFFVIDQRAPLAAPRDLGPREERVRKRFRLLSEQLQPRGKFGLDDSEVINAGNGSLIDLAWLRDDTKLKCGSYWEGQPEFDATNAVLSQINVHPPVLNRGSSYLSQISPSARFNEESCWVQQVIGDPVLRMVFARPLRMVYCAEVPDEGVSSAQFFADGDAWREQGLCTADAELREKMKAL